MRLSKKVSVIIIMVKGVLTYLEIGKKYKIAESTIRRIKGEFNQKKEDPVEEILQLSNINPNLSFGEIIRLMAHGGE